MKQKALLSALAFVVSQTPILAQSQTAATMDGLKGLSVVTVLSKTDAGRAALGANFTVTGGIQRGEWSQTTLLPYTEQQQQALRDVFLTRRNLAQLASGLGTTLYGAYVARAHYIDRTRFTAVSDAVTDLATYSLAVALTNSETAKFFFANRTLDGTKPASSEALAILTEIDGQTDMFGHAYRLEAGAKGGGIHGNSRPFQTQPAFERITGRDYFGTPADNTVYNRGPMMDLNDSPSFPSGHTVYGYTGSLLLAFMVPERYPEMIARGADYGNNRIIVGAHYAMDVLAGRALAFQTMAKLLANNENYVGQTFGRLNPISDFRAAVSQARSDVRKVLESGCGKTIVECASEDIGPFSDPTATSAFYASTQTYGLPVVYPDHARGMENVGKLAPEAGYLLTVAFPSLSLDEANRILSITLGPGGGFLDNGSEFGVYSRLDLLAASQYVLRQNGLK